MLDEGIDRVVMGCTHYPFVIPLIQEIVGPGIQVIDPAPAVARQVGRVLNEHELLNSTNSQGQVRYLTSGDPIIFSGLLRSLMGEQATIDRIIWQAGDQGLEPQINADRR
jgi:glutamate racemase